MSLRLIIIGIVALTIVTAVGGTIYAAKAHLDGLNATITSQQEQIAGLTTDLAMALASNESLQRENDRKAEESKGVREELERLRKSDAESQERLTEIQRKLRSAEEIKRRKAIRNSRKASLLLRLVNKDIKCQIENFDRVDGKCVRGRWVETGKRLVPKVTPKEIRGNTDEE